MYEEMVQDGLKSPKE